MYSPDFLRAWWAHRQGLTPDPAADSCAAVLARSGWARSVGGCGPYLTFFSRAGISRETVDKAVARLEIHELPSARGCTYVVPSADFPLALRLAQNSGSSEMRTAEKLGVTRKEIDKLCEAVLLALRSGPLDPEGIREASGKAVRNLGDEGRKKGLTTTLPVALELLQNSGDIRRVPVNGRLDQQRYQYVVWRPNPLQNFKLDFEQSLSELARRFFAWIGPARLAEFQAFAGVSAKAAKTAVQALSLEPISKDSDLLLLPADRAAFASFKPPKEPCYRLLTSVDSLLLLRRDLATLMNPEDGATVLTGQVRELPSPVIIDRGRIAGLWEYDPATESVVHAPFGKKSAQLKAAVASTEEYVRTQLGDARTFTLDSPKSRAPRIEALRKLNG